MTPTDTDIKEALQRLDRALTPAPVLAAKAVAEFRGQQAPQPWINRTTGSGAPLLDRDAVLRRSEPNHAPKVEVKQRSLLDRLRRR